MLNQSRKEELIASKRALQSLSETPTETTHTFFFFFEDSELLQKTTAMAL